MTQRYENEYGIWKRYHPVVTRLDRQSLSEEMKVWLQENCGPRSIYPDDADGAWSYWAYGVFLFKDEK